MGKSFIINFCIVSADLLSSVVEVYAKRENELSTDHHLVVCIVRGLNHLKTRKLFKKARRACGIELEFIFEELRGINFKQAA